MQATQPAVTFEGTDDERQLAEQVFFVARMQGKFFPATAPIHLKRDELVAFLASRDKGADPAELGERIDAALGKNPAAFAHSETDDGVVSYVTTRNGTAPVAQVEDTLHTLARRFMEPVEIVEPAPVRKPPAQLIAGGWSQRPVFDGIADEPGLDELVPPTLPAAPAPMEAGDPGAFLEPADATPSVLDGVDEVAAEPAATALEVPLPTAPMTAAEAAIEELRAALVARLEGDDRFASFGDRYYSEDMVDRYSRGDLRRIREYILEMNEPLSDDQLLQDLFSRRPNDPTYEAARFSINYRLAREKREFEFVGTRDSRLWSTTGLAPLGTTQRKASELGTDYRYLQDEPAVDPGASVTHVLTFFEWTYGLLPLDGALRSFFPEPYLEDQKTAVLRFEVPQLYATFLAEVRYATGNRGGYLVGFDEFYRENLVPGATFVIERMPNNDGQFVIKYATTSAREVRTLQIDERRNRYVFRPQSVFAQLDEAWLIAESRFPRLANLKPLDDRERRRAETVVGNAFERAAENVGTKAQPRYWSTPDELLPVVNIERPFSLDALRDLLESPQYSQFSADHDTPGAFFYEPPAKTKEPAASKKRGAQVADDLDDDLSDEESE